MKPERRIAYRRQVAALIESVLDETITARDAINAWPSYCNEDPSVQAVYTMLWYFESDEDRRWQEMHYSDVQFQLLIECVNHLKQGNPLPLQLLDVYRSRQAPPDFSLKWLWTRPLWSIKALTAWMKRLFRTSLALAVSRAV